MATLCTGCAMTLSGQCSTSDSCGTPVGECGDCAPCGGCGSPACDECGTSYCAPSNPCGPLDISTCDHFFSAAKCYGCSCCSNVWCRMEPTVCWPWRKCCRAINFCVPEGCCGPPTPRGP